MPYYGAALAFDVVPLMFAGVRPLWYLRGNGDRRRAIQQLIDDGVYSNVHEVREFDGHHYGDECEWQGPHGLRFDPQWIESAWIWPRRATIEELETWRDELAWLLPGVPIEFGKPEVAENQIRRPCK